MNFPYGKAPFWILAAAVFSGLGIVALNLSREEADTPDLVVAVFAPTHYEAYRKILKDYREETGFNVQVQQVQFQALQNRLQSAMLAGLDEPQPDLVEVERQSFGFFTKGPIEDVGFIDLTDMIKKDGLDKKMVASRMALWTNRGRAFGIPHDVHPVGLAYRKDITDSLGIDVSKIKTWDDFVEVGQKITADLDGDGLIDRYALEASSTNGSHITTLMLQKGVRVFDENGKLTMNDPKAVDVILWYVRQISSPNRIAFPVGETQGGYAQAMADGLVVFFLAPDWRTSQFQSFVSSASGKMAFMPLPAWEEGGIRTSTWGGTCMAITQAARNKGRLDLAWDVLNFLYTNEKALPEIFQSSNILPPFKDVWNDPLITKPNEFYSGQSIGKTFIELADETPVDYISPYSQTANEQILAVFVNALNYYEKNGEEGLREYTEKQLAAKTKIVARDMGHNRFLAEQQ